MSALKAYEEFMERQREMNKSIAENGRQLLLEMFEQYFAKYPELMEVNWYQYIPGFNDGDPCEFTLGELNVKYTKAFYESLSAQTCLSKDQRYVIDRTGEAIKKVQKEYPDTDFDALTLSEVQDALDHLEDFLCYPFSGFPFSGDQSPLNEFPSLELLNFRLEEHENLLHRVFGNNRQIWIRRNPDGSIQMKDEYYDCGY